MNILPQSQFQLNHGYSAWKVLGTEMKLISLPTISTREVFPPCLNLHSGLKQVLRKRTPKTTQDISTLVHPPAWVQLD